MIRVRVVCALARPESDSPPAIAYNCPMPRIAYLSLLSACATLFAGCTDSAGNVVEDKPLERAALNTAVRVTVEPVTKYRRFKPSSV